MNWPACYEIRVAEALESRWLQCFLDHNLFPAQDSPGTGTRLVGMLRDQADLFGALARVRDLNLTLLEIRRIEKA